MLGLGYLSLFFPRNPAIPIGLLFLKQCDFPALLPTTWEERMLSEAVKPKGEEKAELQRHRSDTVRSSLSPAGYPYYTDLERAPSWLEV